MWFCICKICNLTKYVYLFAVCFCTCTICNLTKDSSLTHSIVLMRTMNPSSETCSTEASAGIQTCPKTQNLLVKRRATANHRSFKVTGQILWPTPLRNSLSGLLTHISKTLKDLRPSESWSRLGPGCRLACVWHKCWGGCRDRELLAAHCRWVYTFLQPSWTTTYNITIDRELPPTVGERAHSYSHE